MRCFGHTEIRLELCYRHPLRRFGSVDITPDSILMKINVRLKISGYRCTPIKPYLIHVSNVSMRSQLQKYVFNMRLTQFLYF